jgi:hypothetical protein
MNRKKALGYIEELSGFFNAGWSSLLKFEAVPKLQFLEQQS